MENLVPIQLGFSAMEHMARSKGYAVIVKDDKAAYLMLDISNEKDASETIEHLERMQMSLRES